MSQGRYIAAAFVLMLLFHVNAVMAGGPQTGTQPVPAPAITAMEARTAPSSFSEEQVVFYRSQGPAGLEQAMQKHAEALNRLREMRAQRISDEVFMSQEDRAAHQAQWAEKVAPLSNVKNFIDQVAGQYDADTSGLFWFTDMEQAKAYAREHNKPILSLRLLGKLTDEYSCANSRFFRSILYTDPAVSKHLRDNFVLHWSTERPVPIVTVDFGDGRVLKRTVTGNSIHYVMDMRGRVVDAVPGLMAPQPWLDAIKQAQTLAQAVAEDSDADAATRIAQAHTQRLTELTAQWQRLTEKTDLPGEPEQLTEAQWEILAASNPANVQLSPQTIEHMRRQQPQISAERAMELATSKSFVEDPIMRVVQAMMRSVAVDTVRNQYLMHRQIHQWLAQSGAGEFDQLNQRVYAELFKTPRSDPWLGLATNSYAALNHNGELQQPLAAK